MSNRPKKRQRTAAELAQLIRDVTASSYFADRLPNELCMVVGILSKEHRDSLKEAKRKISVLNLIDVTQSVELLEEANRVAPSLGLP